MWWGREESRGKVSDGLRHQWDNGREASPNEISAGRSARFETL